MSGTFRDPADFAVAILYDADNFYEHPSIKYLPDFNFAGLTLNFSVQYSDGLQPIDSPKYNWIDWATLDCIREDESKASVPLWNNAMLENGFVFSNASAAFNVLSGPAGIQPFDRVTLWYQNLAFDYVAPNETASAEFQFFAEGTGTVHSMNINGRPYAHTEVVKAGESSPDQANALIAAINSPGDPDVVASSGSVPYSVLLTVRPSSAGNMIPVSASDGNLSVALGLTTPALVASNLTAQINSTDWVKANPSYALMATQAGAQITVTAARFGTVATNGTSVTLVSGAVFSGIAPGAPIFISLAPYVVASVVSPTQLSLTTAAPMAAAVPYLAPRGGRDGNEIQLYATSKTSTLNFDRTQIQLSGGRSDTTWNVRLDFSALGIDQLRQCWLTFAPSLVNAPYTSTEWQAVFSNWQLTGTDPSATRDNKAITFAGPGSVRLEDSDKACVYTGTWVPAEPGFYSRYFAKKTNDSTATLTIAYQCQQTHDLYIGTSLYTDRGVMGVRVDNDVETSLDCRLTVGTALIARRRARQSVAPGRHVVTIRLQQPGWFYFDFLEAVVLSDVPAPLTPRTNISPALDFDTDHTYKLTPSRLMWIFDQLGYAGPMNEYLGVFWWNERVNSGGSFSTAQVAFTGTFGGGDAVFVTVDGTTLGKSVFPADTPATIATHFAMYINGAFTGAWASASGPRLTITSRSPAPPYNLTVSASATSASGGQATVITQPQPGQYGTWLVNDSANPPINRATRDWHADFYSQCAARSREVVTACSMELVNPPAGYAAQFSDGTAVSTATGFGTLVSNHCAAGGSKLLAYQKAVYRNIASLQAAAGLAPSVQYGEFLWWYFPLSIALAVGYASYTTPISIGTAAPHGLTTGERVVIAGVAGNTAANGDWIVTIVDPTHFTLNASAGNGTYTSGGTVTMTGGMAFYDDETTAAAQTALGRPLHLFSTPNDDPAVNGSADAIFLRNRLRDHVGALIADMRSAFPSAKCEVLWPYDVNYPVPVPVTTPIVGGQLNRFINLPVEWQQKSSSGLDRMKIEALAFGTSMRDLDLAKAAIGLFPGFGWPVDSLRYLVPIFGVATPWHRELALAHAVGITTNNLWAFDHICLYNLDVPEKKLERRSIVKAA